MKKYADDAANNAAICTETDSSANAHLNSAHRRAPWSHNPAHAIDRQQPPQHSRHGKRGHEYQELHLHHPPLPQNAKKRAARW